MPLDSSVLYIRPLYVTSTSNPLPQLRYVIAVFNQDVSIEPTLESALTNVLGASVTGITGSKGKGKGKTSPEESVANYLDQASAFYADAQKALAAGNLGLYQRDVNAMNEEIQQALNLSSPGSTSTTTTTGSTTTTTTIKGSTSTTTTTAPKNG